MKFVIVQYYYMRIMVSHLLYIPNTLIYFLKDVNNAEINR